MQIELSQELRDKEKLLKEAVLAAVDKFEKETFLTVSTLNLGITTRETRAGSVLSGKSFSVEYQL
jgi:hypothetical protein